MVEANVAFDRAQPDRLLPPWIDLNEGLCPGVPGAGGSGDEVAVAAVVESLGQVDVLIPEEEALVEATDPFPELTADDEARARGLANLDRHSSRRAGMESSSEGAGKDPHKHRRPSGKRRVVAVGVA